MKQQRPHVSVNMAMSVDGRISTRRREHITLGTAHDRLLMDRLRSANDAVVVGAGTVRHDGFPILVRDDATREARVARGRAPHPVNVVLSRSLDLPTNRPLFKRSDTEKIVVTTRRATAARIRRISRVAEVVVLPRQTLSPTAVLDLLWDRGMKKVLLEGGGEVHFAFARERVVDELYITVTPRLIGGTEAPSILDGRGFLKDEHVRLTLVSCRRIDDELFLRYRVKR
jgi:2,5-diamino-6-(ribosylamino)-4(3H)-pyrimidinone 5'-phosphate reductase